jgi:asparagine synthetase B (glutamine-hydrolysing)
MCGIIWLWNLNGQPVPQRLLECFTDSLAHRGPDGNGFYIDSKANLGLGYRWLAILDTSDGGRQPMPFDEERYWITYNGEMYNFLELQQIGYHLRTDLDTEVILASYHHLSMAHGVEVRSSFMDWRLVCFVFSLPAAGEIGSGFTKRILRESIRTRTRKRGFPNLTEAWTSSRAQAFIRDVVSSVEFRESSLWDGRKVAEDLEVAIRDQDNETLHQAWIYVQAASLMRLFREKQRMYA